LLASRHSIPKRYVGARDTVNAKGIPGWQYVSLGYGMYGGGGGEGGGDGGGGLGGGFGGGGLGGGKGGGGLGGGDGGGGL
jgi:hypothetical protein